MRAPAAAVGLALTLAVAPSAAHADPGDHGSAGAELRLHRADTQQDEVPHHGLYPSIIVSGSATVLPRLEIVAAVAAARVSAVWENIGGVANGMLGARTRLDVPALRGRVVATAGVAFPLDSSIPEADCYMPDHPGGGDSLVLRFGDNPGCWDRSAHRRAALHRGAWDIWMWAPDWVTAFGTGRLESTRRPGLHHAVDVGAGAAFALTDAHDDDSTALVAQGAAEVGYWFDTRWLVGARGLGAAVFLDDTSPAILSVEPFAELAHGSGLRLRAAVLLPLEDLQNDDVAPGLGGYRIAEHKSLGLYAGVAF